MDPTVIKYINNQRLVILTCILLFAFFINAQTVFIPHNENDEIIYGTLSEKIIRNPLDYSLQETKILSELPKIAYDYPIFRHPPLFVIFLAITKVVFDDKVTFLMPCFFALLTIVMTYLIAVRLYSSLHGLVASMVLTLCPLWMLLSARVWIETTYVFFVTLTFYLTMIACDKRKLGWFAWAGLALGLALLTKHSSLLILPGIISYICYRDFEWSKKLLYFFIIIVTAFLINLPWFMYYFHVMGTLSYLNQYSYTTEAVRYPFIFDTLHRPIYYFFTTLIETTPVFVLSLCAVILMVMRGQDLTMAIWALSVLFLCTLGGSKLGFTMRFVATALPALSIMGAWAFFEILNKYKKINGILVIIGSGALFYGMAMGILNISILGGGDIVKPSEIWNFLSQKMVISY